MDPQNMDQIISSLPKENGWLSDENAPLYYHQGFWYYAHYIRGVLSISSSSTGDGDGLPGFNPTSSDIIICSTPKSGTTWLKALTFAIATRSRYAAGAKHSSSDHPLNSTIPHDLIPLIEVDVAQRNNPRSDPQLPLYATHLPYTSLPAKIPVNGCKIVYIWRDPKDAFVSRWLFAHKIRRNKHVSPPIPLEEAFDLFCRGVSPFGPYWDHVVGYWKACLDRPDKVLFLKYEDMKSDVEGNVKRLAEFMGYPFSNEEETEGILGKIVEMCSFESLRRSAVNNRGTFRSTGLVTIGKEAFYRKGEVGDWKNYLTQEMATEMDRITVEKLGKFGLV